MCTRVHFASPVAAAEGCEGLRSPTIAHRVETREDGNDICSCQIMREGRKVIMKPRILAGISIFAVAASVGWMLASHPETSAGLQEISLTQHSEHSQPDATEALSRIRIRLSPSDVNHALSATDHEVPQISLTAE